MTTFRMSNDASQLTLHPSFVKFGSKVDLKRCSDLNCSCQNLYHCPFCDLEHFKATKPCRVQSHLEESHWPSGIFYKDIFIVRCFHLCLPDSSGHFHCPVCPEIINRRLTCLQHLQNHLLVQNEDINLAFAPDAKLPETLVHDDFVIELCTGDCGCPKGINGGHYHCPGCGNGQETTLTLGAHMRRCLALLQYKKPLKMECQPYKDLENPRTVFPKWHRSVIRNMSDIPIRRCASRRCCNRKYHCPLCPLKQQQPELLADLRVHFISHVDNSVEHEGYTFLACRLLCDPSLEKSNTYHFHCAYCGRIGLTSTSFRAHLIQCQQERKVIGLPENTAPNDNTIAAETLPHSKIEYSMTADSDVTVTNVVVENCNVLSETSQDMCEMLSDELTNQNSEIRHHDNVHDQSISTTTTKEIPSSSDYNEDDEIPLMDEEAVSVTNDNKLEDEETSMHGNEMSTKKEDHVVVANDKGDNSTQTEPAEPTSIEMFEKVTAQFSQPFLRVFDFASREAAEKLFSEVAMATEVIFNSSPGTDPLNPVFCVEGSLRSVLNTESLLHQKFSQANPEPKIQLLTSSDQSISKKSPNREEIVNPEIVIIKTKVDLPTPDDFVRRKRGRPLNQAVIRTGKKGRPRKINVSIEKESTADRGADKAEGHGIKKQKTGDTGLRKLLDSRKTRAIANTPHRYNTRGYRVDTSMLRSANKPKTHSSESDDDSCSKHKTLQTSKEPCKTQEIVIYNKMPDSFKTALELSDFAGIDGPKPIPYSSLPDGIKQFLPQSNPLKPSDTTSDPDSFDPKALSRSQSVETSGDLQTEHKACLGSPIVEGGNPLVSKASENVSIQLPSPVHVEILNTCDSQTDPKFIQTGSSVPSSSKFIVQTSIPENSTDLKSVNPGEKTSHSQTKIELSELQKKKSFYMPSIAIHRPLPSMELVVERSAINDQVIKMTKPYQEKIETLSKDKVPDHATVLQKNESPAGKVPDLHSIVSELDKWENDSDKNMSYILEWDCSYGDEAGGLVCPICQNQFHGRGHLSTHIMSSHCKVKCHLCMSIFTTRENLTSHIQQSHSNNSEASVKDALEHNLGSEFHRCGECKEVFASRKILDRHQSHIHPYKIECRECKKTFKGVPSLLSHIKCIHLKPKEVTVCDICGKTFKKASYVQAHKKRHEASRIFPCQVCGKTFKDRYSVRDHEEIHKPKEERRFRYVCQYCGKRFMNKRMFNDHTNLHTGNRPYKCEACGKCFSHMNILSKHTVTMHSDKRPFQCHLCDKNFKVKSALKSHIVTHTGVSNHRCGYCKRAFGNRNMVKAHVPKCKAFKAMQAGQSVEVVEEFDVTEGAPASILDGEVILTASAPNADGEVITDPAAFAEAMKLAFEADPNGVELQLSTEEADSVMQESFMYMCSACQTTFNDFSTAQVHINQCQGETTETNLVLDECQGETTETNLVLDECQGETTETNLVLDECQGETTETNLVLDAVQSEALETDHVN